MDSLSCQPQSPVIDWPSALDANGSWIRQVVHARVPTTQDVDDVVQEISAAVLKQRGKRPDDPDKVAPWLYGVAVRQSSQFLRKRGQQERLLDTYAAKRETTSPENPRDWVMRRERHQTLRKSLESLDTDEREILLLKYTEDLSYSQLADLLGITVKMVEHRLLNARTALRIQLQHHDD